jgi:hypothetical protein
LVSGCSLVRARISAITTVQQLNKKRAVLALVMMQYQVQDLTKLFLFLN